ncbi:MAG: hypothetical protein OXG05_06050 [Gammaproteobacteria bacterium]|nr:hypothetical protein [Gammaproteobacteria bacterium]
MYKNARQRIQTFYKPVERFWNALLRFGSPRFSIETFSEFVQTRAANDDKCSDETVDCPCQLQVA